MAVKCWVCGAKSYWQVLIPTKADPFKAEMVEICKGEECVRLTNKEIVSRRERRRKTDNHVSSFNSMQMELDEWEQTVSDIVQGVDKGPLDRMTNNPVPSLGKVEVTRDHSIIDHFMASQENCKSNEERGRRLRALDTQELRWLNEESDAIYPKIRHRSARTVPDSLEEEFGLTTAQIEWIQQVERERSGKD